MTKEIYLEGLLKEDDSLIFRPYVNVNDSDWIVLVPTSQYEQYLQKNHRVQKDSDYLKFLTPLNPLIIEIAEKLTEGCKTKEDEARVLFEFAQKHFYDKRIEKEKDYVKYPLQLIVEKNGDCEDLVILAASLIATRGINTAMLLFPPLEGEDSGHMALAIEGNFEGVCYTLQGKKYFYAETTHPSWKIGRKPDKYKGVKAKAFLIDPLDSLVF